MARYDAIADVTRTLKTLLLDRVEYPDAFDVLAVPPEVTTPTRDTSGPWLDLFLFRVTENASLMNQSLPSRNSGGDALAPLSLDLHYLLSARGSGSNEEEVELSAQTLLGSAMRVLHDMAIITEDLRVGRASGGMMIGEPVLAAGLRGERERIKIDLQSLGVDDVSKLWSVFPQINFRLSAAYQVSVVQIESRRPRVYPRPVGEPPTAGPRVYAIPSPGAHIRMLRVLRDGEERPHLYARISETLVLLGQGFVGPGIRVYLGLLELAPALLQARRIELEIPDEATLQPGPQSVQVSREIVMGEPPRPHLGFRSNLAFFMLVPRVDGMTPALDLTPRQLRIVGERLYLEGGGCQTLIDDSVVDGVSYVGTSAPTEIRVPLPDGLPDWPSAALLSGDLSSFPDPADMDTALQVIIGGDGPHGLVLAPLPADLEAAATALQAVLRSLPLAGRGFHAVRVLVLGTRLLVLPGGLRETVEMGGPAAEALRLSAATGAAAVQVYLSGRLRPFPPLNSTSPQVNIRTGVVTRLLSLAGVPGDPGEAANLLLNAMRDAGLVDAEVGLAGEQLVILTGDSATDVEFSHVSGVDESTLTELRLSAAYGVRVRVNGVEDIDNRSVVLP